MVFYLYSGSQQSYSEMIRGRVQAFTSFNMEMCMQVNTHTHKNQNKHIVDICCHTSSE